MSKDTGPWAVQMEPDGRNPGGVAGDAVDPDAENTDTDDKNVGGMVIFVANYQTRNREEVSRVGWVRRNTANPNHSFRDQLRVELEKAQTAAENLNTYHENRGQLS